MLLLEVGLGVLSEQEEEEGKEAVIILSSGECPGSESNSEAVTNLIRCVRVGGGGRTRVRLGSSECRKSEGDYPALLNEEEEEG